MKRRVRRLFAFAAAGVVSLTTGCTGTPPAGPQSGGIPASSWHAILIAGDSTSPAFDNGVEALREKLQAHGVSDISVYSADPASVPPERVSSSTNVRTALRSNGGAACFVFVTSHGSEDGFFLGADRRIIGPTFLDRALSEGCGAAPTVLIVSACHSGAFINDDTRRPNRVILAAAAVDRTSFGCGADNEFTWYDWCLLRQFDGAATWGQLALATRSCVEGLERRMGVSKASQPQLFVGSHVSDLRLPGR